MCMLVRLESTVFIDDIDRHIAAEHYENLYSPKNGRNNNELTNSTNKQQ